MIYIVDNVNDEKKAPSKTQTNSKSGNDAGIFMSISLTNSQHNQ